MRKFNYALVFAAAIAATSIVSAADVMVGGQSMLPKVDPSVKTLRRLI